MMSLWSTSRCSVRHAALWACQKLKICVKELGSGKANGVPTSKYEGKKIYTCENPNLKSRNKLTEEQQGKSVYYSLLQVELPVPNLCAAHVISFVWIPTSLGRRLVEQRSCIPCAPMQRFMDIPENREQYWPCQPLLWWWFSPLLLYIFNVQCTFLCSASKCLCVFDWLTHFLIVWQASLCYMFSQHDEGGFADAVDFDQVYDRVV